MSSPFMNIATTFLAISAVVGGYLYKAKPGHDAEIFKGIKKEITVKSATHDDAKPQTDTIYQVTPEQFRKLGIEPQ